jgi:phage shock protein A
LAHRYSQLVDLYYQIKEGELKIEMKERDIKKEKDELKRKILELQKEKMELQFINQMAQVRKVVKEARVFYKIYQSHPEFHNLTEKEIFQLEAESWVRKTLNLPTVFEERYGKDYMIKAIGEENYRKYLEIRRKAFGLLPREIFEVKKLPEKRSKKKVIEK